jgi:hypothetical protein
MKTHTLMAAAMACLMLAGCGSEEDALRKALAAEFDQPLCMEVGRSIPFTIVVSNPVAGAPNKPWVDILVNEGLVKEVATSRRGGGLLSVVEGTYDVTPKGRKIQQDNTLCYGKTRLSKLVGYLGPQDRDGMKVVQAEIVLKHEITEGWARDPAFRGRVEEGEETINAILLKSDKGWRVK